MFDEKWATFCKEINRLKLTKQSSSMLRAQFQEEGYTLAVAASKQYIFGLDGKLEVKADAIYKRRKHGKFGEMVMPERNFSKIFS